MNANKEYLEHLYKFWDKYYQKIDWKIVREEDVSDSLEKFKKELKRNKYVRLWSIQELAWWGLTEELNDLYLSWDPENPFNTVPEGYILWEWGGKKFLINEKTYDAYNVKETKRVIEYGCYEIIK